MKSFVLDASAVLAYLQNEPGKLRVAVALHSGLISAVNLSEVVAKLSEKKVTEEEISKQVQALQKLGLKIIPFDEKFAYCAGLLRPDTKKLGLSFGDRACLALGLEEGLPVLSCEHGWKKLDQEKFWIIQIR